MNAPPIALVLPAKGSIQGLLEATNLPPFGPEQLGFAAALSRLLTTQSVIRPYPELVALGFWLRLANLQRMQQAFVSSRAGRSFLPRGVVFHVAPSNVDTIFVYSWLLSLLAGNRNVIRISSRESPQTRLLLDCIAELFALPQWQGIAARTAVVRYGHEDVPSAWLSNHCDLRVVWGGDATVEKFRNFKLPVHATELNFANKLSLCMLDSAGVAALQEARLAQLANAFCNDAYWFGQMACSSPHLVFWLGGAASAHEAEARFWVAVKRELDSRADSISAANSMNKVVAADSIAIEITQARIEATDPRVTRVLLPTPAMRDELYCGAGLFQEIVIGELADLLPHLTRRIQTVCYFGIDHTVWQEFVRTRLPAGIDRIVPVGHALDFESTWDGIDLFGAMLREVTIR